MTDGLGERTPRDEQCTTVKCREPATTTLRIEADYESVAGETRTNVFTYDYCDEHAEMRLSLDGVAGKRYEVVDE